MRLAGKIAVVVGAGQSPGQGIGNGRATVLRFAQEGAKILAVDRDLASAEETAALAAKSGGECVAFQADVTRETTLAAAMVAAALPADQKYRARPRRGPRRKRTDPTAGRTHCYFLRRRAPASKIVSSGRNGRQDGPQAVIWRDDRPLAAA